MDPCPCYRCDGKFHGDRYGVSRIEEETTWTLRVSRSRWCTGSRGGRGSHMSEHLHQSTEGRAFRMGLHALPSPGEV